MVMKSLQGHFLVAAAGLLDPNFYKSVVLILQHNQDGAMGIIINRPTTMTLIQAWKQVSEKPCGIEDFLYQGGPCEGPLMVLHHEKNLEGVQLFDGVCFSTEATTVEWIVEQSASPARFFVGYSGWGPGQLEAELQEGGWQVIPASKETIFGSAEGLWDALTHRLLRNTGFPGVHPKRIPPDPSVN